MRWFLFLLDILICKGSNEYILTSWLFRNCLKAIWKKQWRLFQWTIIKLKSIVVKINCIHLNPNEAKSNKDPQKYHRYVFPDLSEIQTLIWLHWFLGSCFFLGPSKMRTSQKTHQLNQYKTRGDVGPFRRKSTYLSWKKKCEITQQQSLL